MWSQKHNFLACTLHFVTVNEVNHDPTITPGSVCKQQMRMMRNSDTVDTKQPQMVVVDAFKILK